jgi:signal transduction histidine kinase
VSALARETADKVRPLAAAKQLTLTVQTPGADASEEETRVWADADRLRQALLIFLDNAVRYTPAGGTIRVAVHTGGRPHLLGERGHQVAIEVSDTGAGIASEHLPHLFEPFYRATMHHVSEDGESGTGLGLALAQWIAHAHGGEIMVTSTPGQGTTFMLTVPTDRK